jgi:hypothetical protein
LNPVTPSIAATSTASRPWSTSGPHIWVSTLTDER